MKDIVIKIQSYYSQIAVFFVVFYLVGITGTLLPVSFHLFTKLIPFALLLSAIGLILFHSDLNKKSMIIFAIIYITGFVTELIGVNTGAIFGSYYYGNSLGLSLWNTPLIIGLNWLLLVYLTSSILEKTNFHVLLKVLTAALLMVVYDIIIEQVAPLLDMWYWEKNKVPFQNYAAWLIIAILFQSLIKRFKVNTTNKLASVILICQTVFFLVLTFTLQNNN